MARLFRFILIDMHSRDIILFLLRASPPLLIDCFFDISHVFVVVVVIISSIQLLPYDVNYAITYAGPQYGFVAIGSPAGYVPSLSSPDGNYIIIHPD